MLYDFLKDMWDILRLRYKNPADYFYTLPVILAILLLLGMVNAGDSLHPKHPSLPKHQQRRNLWDIKHKQCRNHQSFRCQDESP